MIACTLAFYRWQTNVRSTSTLTSGAVMRRRARSSCARVRNPPGRDVANLRPTDELVALVGRYAEDLGDDLGRQEAAEVAARAEDVPARRQVVD